MIVMFPPGEELIATFKTERRKRASWRIVCVPGRAGVALSERADALAREAVHSRLSSVFMPATMQQTRALPPSKRDFFQL